MAVPARNLLFLMSDQHNRAMAGCYGHPAVRTPNLDLIASRGVRFTSAYCNCPICVPSRASMATGRYVHQLGLWDNAFPYTGGAASWGHRLAEHGHTVTTIGKLHYRDPADDTGFPDQRIPMHVHEGVGELYTLIRSGMGVREASRDRVTNAGIGESSYTTYDRAIADEACRWLGREGRERAAPWVLFVSFATPHHPWIAPPEFAALYPPESVPLPAQYRLAERPRHPVLDEIRRVQNVADEFDEDVLRRAIAAYFGLCTFMDAQVGRVLGALREAGLEDSTRIIYTSDHGESLGEHGLWWKSTMYEGSAGVPLLFAGPDLPAGSVVDTPVSLVDCFPTILECAGVPPSPDDGDLPGTSLFRAAGGEDGRGTVFSEYHAASSSTGYFMIRGRHYKYVEYVGEPPQLFDLADDPGELRDLGCDPRYRDVVDRCAAELRRICDPEDVDRLAHRDQRRKMDEHGGEAAIRARGPRFNYGTPAPAQFPRAAAGEDRL
jgi:choline-sulfatase